MADYIGTVGERIKRDRYVRYVNVGTGETKEWEAMGWGVSSTGTSIDIDSETVNDVLGNTIVNNKSVTETQSFDPNDIRVGDKLNLMLIEKIRNRDLDYSGFEVLTVYGFLGSEGQYEAEVDTNCTIKPSGEFGGEGTMSMPVEVTMSGNRTKGTTNVFKQTKDTAITFTAS